MSEAATPSARILTMFGTAAYVGSESGELRHGLADT
jgi:hypothetical protein